MGKLFVPPVSIPPLVARSLGIPPANMPPRPGEGPVGGGEAADEADGALTLPVLFALARDGAGGRRPPGTGGAPPIGVALLLAVLPMSQRCTKTKTNTNDGGAAVVCDGLLELRSFLDLREKSTTAWLCSGDWSCRGWPWSRRGRRSSAQRWWRAWGRRRRRCWWRRSHCGKAGERRRLGV